MLHGRRLHFPLASLFGFGHLTGPPQRSFMTSQGQQNKLVAKERDVVAHSLAIKLQPRSLITKQSLALSFIHFN